MRHFFYDWDTEVPSSLQIERLGDEVEADDRSVAPDVAVSRQLVALGDFVHDNLEFFLQFGAARPANGFLPPIDRTAIGAAAENRPVIGRWELEPDEALILEVEPPAGRLLELLARQSVVGDDSLRPPSVQPQRAPGRRRFRRPSARGAVSARDPGVANWLDTAGHSNGAMILRCVRTETAPTPTTRVVTFADVASALPAEHPATVRPSEERAVPILERARDAPCTRGSPR